MIAIGCSEVVAPAASLGDDKNSNWVDVVLVVTAGAEVDWGWDDDDREAQDESDAEEGERGRSARSLSTKV